MNSGIKALVFDVGDVLIRIDFDRVFRRWAAMAGVPFETVKSRFAFGESFLAFERGEVDSADYFARLRRDLDLGLTEAQLASGWSEVLLPEIEPTVALLPRLARRIPCHLFSNTNVTHYQVWSRRHARALAPLGRRFVSHEMGRRKPEVEAFAHVARELALEPREILFFDDMAANVEGARAAGFAAVHVRNPGDVERAVRPWLDAEAKRS